MLHLAVARQTTVISSIYYGSWQERVAVALQIPFFYLKKTFLPTGISAFYAVDFSHKLFEPQVLLAAVMLAAVAIACCLLRHRFPELLLGVGWFFITLLPVSNLFATSPVVADRYLFLPSIGLAFLIAATLFPSSRGSIAARHELVKDSRQSCLRILPGCRCSVLPPPDGSSPMLPRSCC